MAAALRITPRSIPGSRSIRRSGAGALQLQQRCAEARVLGALCCALAPVTHDVQCTQEDAGGGGGGEGAAGSHHGLRGCHSMASQHDILASQHGVTALRHSMASQYGITACHEFVRVPAAATMVCRMSQHGILASQHCVTA